MNAVTLTRPRAFAVRWRDTIRWDVAFFQQLKWRWPEEIIRPVGDAADVEAMILGTKPVD
jgi:hypothetical protein